MAGPVTGFAVGSVSVSAGVARGSAQVSQQFRGAVVSEFSDCISVGTVRVGVQGWEPDDCAVPAQDFEEQRLPYLVGCAANPV